MDLSPEQLAAFRIEQSRASLEAQHLQVLRRIRRFYLARLLRTRVHQLLQALALYLQELVALKR